MNTTELVIEMRPEKIQARTGSEPMTSAIPVRRSTNCMAVGRYCRGHGFKSRTGQNFYQVLFQIVVQ